jgi:hypothetical protein
LTSSPCSLCERLGLGFLPSAPAAGLAWSHLSCIFNSVATTPIGLRSWQAGWLPGGQHMDLSEARGLVLFRVVREGIGITRRLSAQWALPAYRPLGYSLSNPSVSRTDRPPPRKNRWRWKEVLTRDAQAACDFSFSMSKFSPFFHTVKVMAAILRASVRRTMVGLMPLASERW